MKIPIFTRDLCIVSLANSPWEFPHWISRQFLAYELAKFCPIVYAMGRTQARNVFRLENLKNRYMPQKPPFAPPENLYVQRSPLAAPKIYKYQNLDKILADAYGRLLRKKCKKITNGKIIAYLWEPEHRELLDGLQPDLVVYHPYDKFDAMAKTEESKMKIRLAEKKMEQAADIIITPHQRIADAFNHPNIHVIHNAVFTPAMTDKTDKSKDAFKNIPHPRLGYIGRISAKLDFLLIMEIARKRPDFSIILMGPENSGPWKNSDAVKNLGQLPNVYFFPAVIFDQVFDHMLQLDLGIMPYSLSGHMGYCESPLKMYQYWLCGLSVVTTGLPNMEEQPGIISIGNTTAEWINKIDQQLNDDSDSLKMKRKNLAIENSWQNRAQKVFNVLSQSI